MTKIDYALLDSIDHGVFVVAPDADGKPVYVAANTNFCRVIRQPSSVVLGKTALVLHGEQDGSVAYFSQRDALASGMRHNYEMVVRHSNGQSRIRATLVPLRGEDGAVCCVIGSALEVDLGIAAVSGLSSPTEETEQFISMAAHDLRSPLGQVKAIAELLRDDFVDHGDGKAEMINVLGEIGDRALRIIGDIVAHAQAVSTGQRIVSFGLAESVRDIMQLLDPLGRCHFDVADAHILAEQTVIEVILRNLIDNALKHAGSLLGGQGADELVLSIGLTETSSGITISVSDNGAGFGKDSLAILDSQTTAGGGGFGLYAVRRLIRARGGTLVAADLPGGAGAQVQFSLPGRIIARDDLGDVA